MTNEQASAVNVLINYLTDTPSWGGTPPDRVEARDALVVLATGAHRKLGAGWTPEQVKAEVETYTASGYDPLWVLAINHVLRDRETDLCAFDVDDDVWTRFVGPLVDAYEDEGAPAMARKA